MKIDELAPSIFDDLSFKQGVRMLEVPVWPLCNLFIMLYLASPYEEADRLLGELPDEMEASGVVYCHPADILIRYSDIILPFAKRIKGESEQHAENDSVEQRLGLIRSVTGQQPELFDALVAMCMQDVLSRELEEINSLLCGPCRCDLCCTGPSDTAIHNFFEIPLSDRETDWFCLRKVESAQSMKMVSCDEPALIVDNAPFHDSVLPMLVRWRTGWSLVMPTNTACPNLSEQGCIIYPERPDVCRKPQIFPYVLEKDDAGLLTIRNALLAVWDCPYVRLLKKEIICFSEICGLELFFRENKR